MDASGNPYEHSIACFSSCKCYWQSKWTSKVECRHDAMTRSSKTAFCTSELQYKLFEPWSTSRWWWWCQPWTLEEATTHREIIGVVEPRIGDLSC